ncbi:MAG: FAD-dependent oxidoreductase [Anaerolineae bacterium]
MPTLSNRLLLTAASLTSKTWGIAAAVLPEKLEIDDNRSLWVSQTPDYRPNPPLREHITADLAIIGGGFTGVSTAYHFSERYPDKRVVLLEAKSLANGASGRNGGLMLNWLAVEGGYSPEMTARIYRTTHAAIDMIRAIIERHQLPVSHRAGGVLTLFTDAQRAEAAHAEAEYHQSIGIPTQYLDSAALAGRLRAQGAHGAQIDPNAGQINGAQLVRGLRRVLLERGVNLRGHARPQDPRGEQIALTTPGGGCAPEPSSSPPTATPASLATSATRCSRCTRTSTPPPR